MSVVLEFWITQAARNAIFKPNNMGLELDLTHIQLGDGKRKPNGNETALLAPRQMQAIEKGSRVSLTQINVAALFVGSAIYDISEIGIWQGEPGKAGSILVFYWSMDNGRVGVMSPGVEFVFCHELAVDASIGEKINVIVDTSRGAALALMHAHEQHPNPHPQYPVEEDMAGYALAIVCETARGVVRDDRLDAQEQTQKSAQQSIAQLMARTDVMNAQQAIDRSERLMGIAALSAAQIDEMARGVVRDDQLDVQARAQETVERETANLLQRMAIVETRQSVDHDGLLGAVLATASAQMAELVRGVARDDRLDALEARLAA